jgi:hypothetical protein
MAKKDNNTLIYVIIAALVVIIAGGKAGWFQSVTTNNYQTEMQTALEAPHNDYTVGIHFSMNTMCLGDPTTGYIESNMPNAVCTIYSNPGTGYNNLKTITLNQAGSYQEQININAIGTATIKVICVKDNQYSVSNEAALTVNNCAPVASCDEKCVANGFSQGAPATGPADCTGTSVFASLSGTNCCCVPVVQPSGSCIDDDSGQDLYTYATCESSVSQSGSWDFCSGTKIAEQYCGADLLCHQIITDCPAGTICESGRCITHADLCAESCIAMNGVQYNFHTGYCYPYKTQGIQSMAMTCTSYNSVYVSATGCDDSNPLVPDICCCR